MIIDGNALIHRSFHALPPTMTTKDGTIVNAVYGFASFLLKAMRDLKPDYVVLTLDRKAPTFRHEMFAEYKAGRVKAPDELYAQIPLVRKLAQDFNIPVFEKDGFEADDLIGTIVTQVKNRKLGVKNIIVTGDKDTLQLVDGDTEVYSMSRGLADSIIYDSMSVKERLGVRPDQVIDYKALRGDPSDNIPGVRGIGEKTAVELLAEFESLDKIYLEIEKKTKELETEKKIKPRIIELLVEYKKDAYLSKELATIKCDAPIEFDLLATRFFDLDKGRIVKALSDLEFKSLLPRVQSLFNSPASGKKEKKQADAEGKFNRDKNDFSYIQVADEEAFAVFLRELAKQEVFVFDTETSGLDPLACDLLGISFCWEKGKAHFVRLDIADTANAKENTGQKSLFGEAKKSRSQEKIDWFDRLKSIFADEKIKKIAHNAKFDVRILENKGMHVAGLYFDTMIAAYLLNPGARGNSLDALAFSELGFEKISKDDLLGSGKDRKGFSEADSDKLSLYSCEDADFTWRLYSILVPRLAEKKLSALFTDMEMPLVRVLGEMEDRGVKIDAVFLEKMSHELVKKIKQLEGEITGMAGEDFNVRSTKQLKHILFEKLAIATENIKKNKTGFSTGFEELDKLKGLHPIIAPIQEHRELSKLESTYVKALPQLISSKTGRVHTSFNQTITATGRLSSADPNLQNIPVRTELGREIRKAFVAESGWKLLALDYSQIELRLAAHLSKDEKMIKAFADGADIHTATAAEINNTSLSAVTSEMRREAKAINFGVLYGQGAYGLARGAEISFARAKEFIDGYFAVYSGIARYIQDTIVFAEQNGYVETLFGRKRYLPEINSGVGMVKKAAERMAVNTPIQGTAADMIKLAMIKIAREVNADDVKMIIQVHDELIFEVREEALAQAAGKIRKIMENIAVLEVPIIAEAKAGDNWGEMSRLA